MHCTNQCIIRNKAFCLLHNEQLLSNRHASIYPITESQKLEMENMVHYPSLFFSCCIMQYIVDFVLLCSSLSLPEWIYPFCFTMHHIKYLIMALSYTANSKPNILYCTSLFISISEHLSAAL